MSNVTTSNVQSISVAAYLVNTNAVQNYLQSANLSLSIAVKTFSCNLVS